MSNAPIPGVRVGVPWPEEQSMVESTVQKQGGEWVVAAACIDYAYLSDMAAYARLAWGVGCMTVPRPDREAATLEYHKLLASEENLERVITAQNAGYEIGKEVPKHDLPATAEVGNYFLEFSAGHPAVHEMVAVVERRFLGHSTC